MVGSKKRTFNLSHSHKIFYIYEKSSCENHLPTFTGLIQLCRSQCCLGGTSKVSIAVKSSVVRDAQTELSLIFFGIFGCYRTYLVAATHRK